jgi:hypothetical protein
VSVGPPIRRVAGGRVAGDLVLEVLFELGILGQVEHHRCPARLHLRCPLG